MILLPAIDILDGQAVRLARGEFDAQTVYDEDPLEAAKRWLPGGARALHVVDLDGARSGRAGQPGARATHRRRGRVPVQVGGGLRTIEAVDAAHRRRRGAGSCSAPRRFATSTSSTRRSPSIGDRVVVSVDARGGTLAAGGLDRADRDPRPER